MTVVETTKNREIADRSKTPLRSSVNVRETSNPDNSRSKTTTSSVWIFPIRSILSSLGAFRRFYQTDVSVKIFSAEEDDDSDDFWLSRPLETVGKSEEVHRTKNCSRIRIVPTVEKVRV